MPFEPLPLTQETLATLLNEGTERAGLDYKRRCDLSSNEEKIELTKDLGAMQIHGGYIVIGADDRGQPSGEVTPGHAKLYDLSALHQKVSRYLADGFEIRSTALTLDGNIFGLICVLPHPDGWAPFKANGNYRDKKGREQQAFRAGDVFTRRGSRSERWSHEDVRHIRAEIRRQEREAARRELQEDFLAIQRAASRAGRAATGPASTLSWKLDSDTLGDAIVEQLRADDDIPVLSLLKSTPRAAGELFACGDLDGLRALMDSLTCVIARLIVIERPAYVERAVTAWQAIYNHTFDPHGVDRTDLGMAPAQARLETVSRILALGALAVRERQWRVARTLVARRVAAHDADYWDNWLFHGEVSAARGNLLNDPDNRAGKSPLVIAQEHILRLGCLRPDVDATAEAIITSLCQFDIVYAFVALSTPSGKRSGPFLANFGRWFAFRTDPIVVELINGGELRDVVFPDDDAELAGAIRSVAENARHFSGLVHGWSGYEAQQIHDFLARFPRG